MLVRSIVRNNLSLNLKPKTCNIPYNSYIKSNSNYKLSGDYYSYLCKIYFVYN